LWFPGVQPQFSLRRIAMARYSFVQQLDLCVGEPAQSSPTITVYFLKIHETWSIAGDNGCV
jgi:hypothetical protein